MNTLTVTLPTWFLWTIVGATAVSAILQIINVVLKFYQLHLRAEITKKGANNG